MANINKNFYGELLIDGTLTNDDIAFLNRLESPETVVFKNTKNLSIESLRQIINPKIRYSVVGGLERSKAKYDNEDYQNRTYHSKEELIKIIEYFEDIEKGIKSEMSEMQKAMYIYCCIIQDTNYVTSYRDADFDSKLIENSLTGNLYHKLTCAGIALTYKELLDRQGIKCEYLNKVRSHSFNRIELDGKKYGIDLTWDLSRYEKGNVIKFDYFGRQDSNDFYIRYHDLSKEQDETMDELNTFTQSEIDNCYSSIKPLLENRKKHVAAVDQMTREEKIGALKLHHNYNEIQKEQAFLELIRYLQREKALSPDDPRCAFANKRNPIVSDIVGMRVASLRDIEGIDYPYRFSPTDNFTDIAIRAIDNYMESYIKDFFGEATIYANSIKYVSFEENEELNTYYINLKNKIEYFNSIKDIVTKMGYGEELNYFNFALNREETKRKQKEIYTREEKSQYDYDYDYLSGVLSADEMLNIKDYIENMSGKTISIDEFKDIFTNPSYMRQIFNREWAFTDQELAKLLNEVYNEKIATMMELMNKRSTLKPEEPKEIVYDVDNELETVSGDSFGGVTDNGEWPPFEEEPTGKFI